MKILSTPLMVLLLSILCTGVSAQNNDAKAREIIGQMIETVGGMDALHALKDVQYDYSYKGNTSTERYIFDGEVSYGESTTKEGKALRQYFDGENVKVWVDGKETMAEDQANSAMFTRKTNYYWLTMMQKLTDPGLQLKYAGQREFEGIEYDLVDITFDDNVGVAKDRYLLYVNPHTHLVDQFLFTVMAYDVATPIMMKYTYGVFDGGNVRLPVVSQSHGALNWEGELDPKGNWGARWRTDFKFNNGFTKENIYLTKSR